MKPPAFDYQAPRTVEEAVGILSEYQDEAKVLAGGQSLTPMLNLRLLKPSVLVDINHISGLDGIEVQGDQVMIGGLTRHRSVEQSEELKRSCGLLPRVAGEIADVQVRNRGTFGGSLAHCDPAAEFCASTYTLGGSITAVGKSGERRISAEDFFVGPLMTALSPDELITRVTLPTLNGRNWSFRSVSPRHGDLAIAGVMVVLDFDADGSCQDARIGMFGVGPGPLRASQAEALVQGKRVDAKLAAEAADQAAAESDPETDVRATRAYRLELVKNLVKWNLMNAVGER